LSLFDKPETNLIVEDFEVGSDKIHINGALSNNGGNNPGVNIIFNDNGTDTFISIQDLASGYNFTTNYTLENITGYAQNDILELFA
jgi:hypothetical protein